MYVNIMSLVVDISFKFIGGRRSNFYVKVPFLTPPAVRTRSGRNNRRTFQGVEIRGESFPFPNAIHSHLYNETAFYLFIKFFQRLY